MTINFDENARGKNNMWWIGGPILKFKISYNCVGCSVEKL